MVQENLNKIREECGNLLSKLTDESCISDVKIILDNVNEIEEDLNIPEENQPSGGDSNA